MARFGYHAEQGREQGPGPPRSGAGGAAAAAAGQRAGGTGSRSPRSSTYPRAGSRSHAASRGLGLYGFLLARGDVSVNPVPQGLPTRRERQRPGQGIPLVQAPRMLPRILEPAEVDALTAALRTHRDRAMVAAMVLGGLRRCEVLGLRLGDLRFGGRRIVIAEGKGGHQRLVSVSPRSSPRSATTLRPSARPGRPPIWCSPCSRASAAACRYRRRGWMRSSTAPGAGPGWPTRPAISCGIPA
jgi:integrase/recombinase XerD